VTPLFAHGDFRLYLLTLLAEEPRHGYELIREMEERLAGLYTPSAGSIYPRLAALEEEGLVSHVEEDGRKTYSITDAGRAELESRRDELDALSARMDSAGDIARTIRAEVRTSVRQLRDELSAASREARADLRDELRGRLRDELGGNVRDRVREEREEMRRTMREQREQMREQMRQQRARMRDDHRWRARGIRIQIDGREFRDELRGLKNEIAALVSDVVAAAQEHGIDKVRLEKLRVVLADAREAAVEALRKDEPQPHEDEPPAEGA
jgi:DNA-binding PadR family transcriptional regulator